MRDGDDDISVSCGTKMSSFWIVFTNTEMFDKLQWCWGILEYSGVHIVTYGTNLHLLQIEGAHHGLYVQCFFSIRI